MAEHNLSKPTGPDESSEFRRTEKKSVEETKSSSEITEHRKTASSRYEKRTTESETFERRTKTSETYESSGQSLPSPAQGLPEPGWHEQVPPRLKLSLDGVIAAGCVICQPSPVGATYTNIGSTRGEFD